MKAKLSPFVQKEVVQIHKKDKKLFSKIEKQIVLFETNPKHPSLRLHKLTGDLKNFWSISITRDFRMIYQLKNEDTAGPLHSKFDKTLFSGSR